MTLNPSPEYYTRDRLARAAGCSRSRVSYVLNTRPITPRFRAGGARVYDAAQARLILAELHAAGRRPAPGRPAAAPK